MSAFCRDGRPGPQGRGDSLPRPAFWGRGGSPPFGEGGVSRLSEKGGGFRPAPPAKMIRAVGKWQGKMKVTFSNLSKTGN